MRNTDRSVTTPTGSAANVAIQASGLTKVYSQWQRTGQTRDILKSLFKPEKKTVVALDKLDLAIKPGEFVAYAGANGAGKSTTLKLFSGILQPSSGEARVLGLDPARDRISLMARVGVLFGQRTELWWDHPVAASFDWKAAVWAVPKDEYQRARARAIELLDLGPLMNTFARELSLGQRMRADLGLALLHSPELLLLDEQTLGLDVLAKRHMIHFFKTAQPRPGHHYRGYEPRHGRPGRNGRTHRAPVRGQGAF